MGLDVLTLSLPLPQLWAMQLNKRKKFWLMLMFCVGFLVTIISILRLQVLIQFGDSFNLTCELFFFSSLLLFFSSITDERVTKKSIRRLRQCRILVHSRTSPLRRLRIHAFHPQSSPSLRPLCHGPID